MTISGELKLNPTIEYLEEDFEPMPEGDKQRRNLSYTTEALRLWFEPQHDVYVSGNLFIFYEENNPDKKIAPDTFVVFGMSSVDRLSYKLWEEGGKVPDFVLEITSKGTVRKDRDENPLIYQTLGVKEYFQFDPSGDYLKPLPLQGVRLQKGKYEAIASAILPENILSLHSEVLGLDLRLYPDKRFRFFDPKSNQILRSYAEAEQERSLEKQARREAEAIAEQERQEKLQERQEKLQERQEKLQERQEKERLAAYLRSLGINPDEIP
jgi:Uma2 family endonuclease